MLFIAYFNYWITICLMLIGLYGVVVFRNFVKKMIGLAIFQVSVLLFYIAIADVEGGVPPILLEQEAVYVNPLPHVLMLTAIVVGVSVMAVGMALIVRIKEAYGTIEEGDILNEDKQLNLSERKEDDFS